jgi:predicted GNAT family acetyltransferase
MEIVSLESALEPIFWEHVNQDIRHYYFFAFDWKYNRDETKILLALEGNRIDGMILVYRQSIVQLRGSCEVVKAFLERLDLEKVELQALEQHKQYILEKYNPTVSHEMMLMVLRKGEERLQIKHPLVKLDTSDAEQIATIMKYADPEFWGERTGQQIVERMKQGVNWLGVKVNEELVSVGSTRLTEWAGLIGVVATRETHRNKGYATSIVSELVKQILEKLSIALIYVLTDNPPAIRAYSKVGFKPYRTYLFTRGERQ